MMPLSTAKTCEVAGHLQSYSFPKSKDVSTKYSRRPYFQPPMIPEAQAEPANELFEEIGNTANLKQPIDLKRKYDYIHEQINSLIPIDPQYLSVYQTKSNKDSNTDIPGPGRRSSTILPPHQRHQPPSPRSRRNSTMTQRSISASSSSSPTSRRCSTFTPRTSSVSSLSTSVSPGSLSPVLSSANTKALPHKRSHSRNHSLTIGDMDFLNDDRQINSRASLNEPSLDSYLTESYNLTSSDESDDDEDLQRTPSVNYNKRTLQNCSSKLPGTTHCNELKPHVRRRMREFNFDTCVINKSTNLNESYGPPKVYYRTSSATSVVIDLNDIEKAS